MDHQGGQSRTCVDGPDGCEGDVLLWRDGHVQCQAHHARTVAEAKAAGRILTVDENVPKGTWKPWALVGAVVVVLIAVAALNGNNPAPSLPCYPVASSWLPDLNVPSAKTVLAPDRGGAWIVAAPNGAVWVMTGNPRFDTGGLVLPLNGTARATSDLGILVLPGAPAYQGMTMDEPGVAEALACAKG